MLGSDLHPCQVEGYGADPPLGPRVCLASWDLLARSCSAELLEYLLAEMIRPMAARVGLRGMLASQAEATAWEEVWSALTRPILRTADSPWGVLWRTARCAIASNRKLPVLESKRFDPGWITDR